MDAISLDVPENELRLVFSVKSGPGEMAGLFRDALKEVRRNIANGVREK